MKGYPKRLNSKADYEYVRENFPKEMWEKSFQSLLDTRCGWFNIGEAAGDGVTDDTHKVVPDDETGKKYQLEWKENPDCLMNRLGYTKEEVEKILE